MISQNEFGEIWGNLGKNFGNFPNFGKFPKFSEKKCNLPGRVFVLCGVYTVMAESPVLNHEVNVVPRFGEGAVLSYVAPDRVPGLDMEGQAAAHFR